MDTQKKQTPEKTSVKFDKIAEPAHDKGVKAFANQMPQKYRLNYLRAMSGRSRTAAIKAKCLDCCNWQRKEVEQCAAKTCPLWTYRPYQKVFRHSIGDDTTEKATA